MLNWPGAKGKPSGPGSRIRVKVSAVSFSNWRTTMGRGCMGSAEVRSGSGLVAIEVQELELGGFHAADGHFRGTLHDLVAEGGVLLALAAQAGAVQGQGAHQGDRPGVEVPPEGREPPGPDKPPAVAHGLDGDGPAPRKEGLHRHLAVTDDVEPLGRLTPAA